MLYFFPLFLYAEYFLLSIGDNIGKIIHPTSIKYSEIFQENFVGLIHHSLSSIVLTYIMYNGTWCLNSDWSLSSTDSINCIYNSYSKQLYALIVIFEVSHYIMSIINTLLLKTMKRADQTMLFVHHIVALILIYGATFVAVGEFGTVYVLFTHNLCDIPINIYLLGKNLKHGHINLNKRIVTFLDNVNGIMLITMWVYLRLYMYGNFTYFFVMLYPEETNVIMKISLCVLYILDVIWFFLVLKGIYIELFMKKEKSVLYDKED